MEVINMGGRRWRILETSTLEHIIWMDHLITESGLNRLLQEKAAPDLAQRIWEQISRSDKAFPLLSGMLMPEGLPDEGWTPAVAEETAALLKKLKAPADVASVRALLVSLVLGFFGVAQDYAGLSAIASASRAAGPGLQ